MLPFIYKFSYLCREETKNYIEILPQVTFSERFMTIPNRIISTTIHETTEDTDDLVCKYKSAYYYQPRSISYVVHTLMKMVCCLNVCVLAHINCQRKSKAQFIYLEFAKELTFGWKNDGDIKLYIHDTYMELTTNNVAASIFNDGWHKHCFTWRSDYFKVNILF